MVIERIDLNHFRNYGQLSLFPHEGINILFGQNGSGKTNLLEAVHYCALGKSHRINQDANAVMIGEKGASCAISIRGKILRCDVEVRLLPGEEAVKSVYLNQKKAARLSEMMGVLRCVIFSPEDLDLIKEGPAVRRRFLDMMISQLSRNYFIALQQYRIALNQRNAILKKARMENTRPDGMILDFESAMAGYAETICLEREKYTRMISEKGNQIYQKISGKENEQFTIEYHPSVKWKDEEPFPLAKMLLENREEDLRQGGTTCGPQRDDLILSLNAKGMKMYASQGQMRTGALSLKLAQTQVFQEITGEAPVLLLDDVMSELDVFRRSNLLSMIEGIQTFITCSDEGDFDATQNHRTYRVFSKEGQAFLQETRSGPEIKKNAFREPVFI